MGDQTVIGFAVEKTDGIRVYTWVEFVDDGYKYKKAIIRHCVENEDIYLVADGTMKQCVEHLIDLLFDKLLNGCKLIDAWIGDNWDGEPVGFEVVEKGFCAGDEFEVGWREWFMGKFGWEKNMVFNDKYQLVKMWIRSTEYPDLKNKMGNLRKKLMVKS